MSKFHFKKKVPKNEIPFFFDIFFWAYKIVILMLNGNATFCKNGLDTISFFVKKAHFFRFF
jgi:hypothetical protein